MEWHQLLSLLEAVGTVSETLARPRHKDVDEELLGRLRRMLTGAGLRPT